MMYGAPHDKFGNQSDRAWPSLNSGGNPQIHADHAGNDVAVESRSRPLHVCDNDRAQAPAQRREGHARLCRNIQQAAHNRRMDERTPRGGRAMSMVVDTCVILDGALAQANDGLHHPQRGRFPSALSDAYHRLAVKVSYQAPLSHNLPSDGVNSISRQTSGMSLRCSASRSCRRFSSVSFSTAETLARGHKVFQVSSHLQTYSTPAPRRSNLHFKDLAPPF